MTLVDFDTLVALGNTSEAPSQWMSNSTLPLIRLVQVSQSVCVCVCVHGSVCVCVCVFVLYMCVCVSV